MSLGDFLLFLLAFVGFFLMFVILLQRGRGGGLAGAFGGLGGQSAFGTKAGDVFTVITIVTVVIWVVLACLTSWRIRVEANSYMQDRPDREESQTTDDAQTDPKKVIDNFADDEALPANATEKNTKPAKGEADGNKSRADEKATESDDNAAAGDSKKPSSPPADDK